MFLKLRNTSNKRNNPNGNQWRDEENQFVKSVKAASDKGFSDPVRVVGGNLLINKGGASETSIHRALGIRRHHLNAKLKTQPLSSFASPKGVKFNSDSLIKVRDIGVFSAIETEISGIGIWDEKTSAFSLCEKSAFSGNEFTTDGSRFYVEYHTHPLFSAIHATNEIVIPPSGPDLASLTEGYSDGVAISLVITPNGVFSLWLTPPYQKTLCWYGESSCPKTLDPKAKRPPPIAELVGTVKDASLKYGNEFGEHILTKNSICNSKDRVECATVDGEPAPWCFYKWSAVQEKISKEWTSELSRAFTLNGIERILKHYDTPSKFKSRKFNLAAEALANAVGGKLDIATAKNIPLIEATFIPWRTIENSNKVSVAPPYVLTSWQAPCDRFEVCDPTKGWAKVTHTLSDVKKSVSKSRKDKAIGSMIAAGSPLNRMTEILNAENVLITAPPDGWKFRYGSSEKHEFFCKNNFIRWAIACATIESIPRINARVFVMPKNAGKKTIECPVDAKEIEVFFERWINKNAAKNGDMESMIALVGGCKLVPPREDGDKIKSLKSGRPTPSDISKAVNKV